MPCSNTSKNRKCNIDGQGNLKIQQRTTQVTVEELINPLRGGASEVVDDHDRVLVFDGNNGKDKENDKVESVEGLESATEEIARNCTQNIEDQSQRTDNNNKIGDLNDGVDDNLKNNHEEKSQQEPEEEGDEGKTLQSVDKASYEEYSDKDGDETHQTDEDEGNDSVQVTLKEMQRIETTSEENLNEEIKSFQETLDSKQTEASNLRIQGKQLHDDGDFQSAAQTFQKAASELDFVISIYQENLHEHHEEEELGESGDSDCDHDNYNERDHLSHSDLLKLSEERATCRLHEALCHLKNKNYADSIVSCTDVLMDGVQIVPFTEKYNDDEEDEEKNTVYGNNAKEHQAVVVRISPSGGGGKTATSTIELSAAVRARAYHRRAKARLALGDTTGALDDARSAAFLGDRNAVALYGKLMRESGSSSSLFGGSSAYDGEGFNTSEGGNLFSPTSPLQSLFSGDDNTGNSMNTPSSLDMLGSILGGPGYGSNSASPFGAMGSLGGMLGGINGIGDSNSAGMGGMDGLAKSVLASVSKRIDDRSTQEMVCKFLNEMNASQISSLSSMAGVPLSTSTIDRIVGFANGFTPKKMRKTINLVKRIIFVGNVLLKAFKVIGKYKHLLVVVLLITWMKSAILRPVIIGKKASKKTIETISKAAFFIQ